MCCVVFEGRVQETSGCSAGGVGRAVFDQASASAEGERGGAAGGAPGTDWGLREVDENVGAARERPDRNDQPTAGTDKHLQRE